MAKFQPGQSGNPAGKPKGARTKLSEDLFKLMQAEVDKNGPKIIAALAKKRPADFAKVWASFVSKEIDLTDNRWKDVTLEEAEAIVEKIQSDIRRKRDAEAIGGGEDSAGDAGQTAH